MLPINKKISAYNHYDYNNPRFIIIHYVGANSTAKNNVDYFAGGDRQASAHYFVDDNQIWQSVEDNKGAWHIGNSVTEPNNTNSIGIEMCLVNGVVTEKTEKNTIELTRFLMNKYNIPVDNVRTHAEVTNYRKICPNWQADNWLRWRNFKKKLENESVEQPVEKEQSNKLYRIRKTWEDVKSQIGAYSSLDNAKKACKEGYSIFDNNGNKVYPVEKQEIKQPIQQKSEIKAGLRQYLYLKPHVSKWNVYPTNVAPVIGNQCGTLAPSQFGGLEYEILGNPQPDVYTIQTQSYGKVNIYVPKDNDSQFYTKGEDIKPQSAIPQPKPQISEYTVKEYAEKGVFTCTVDAINFRNKPYVGSDNPVQGQYFKNETVNYDYVVITNKYVWISWISASSGVRRYMPITNKANNEKWGYCV